MKLIACNQLPRASLYKYLGMAKTQLAMNDDDYRALLQKHGAIADGKGYFSAKTLSHAGLEAVLHDMQRFGFKLEPKSTKNKTAKWRVPRINKLNAIWCAMHDAGVVQERAETAMEAFCANRIAGLTHLRWATSEQLNQAVEMLKKYAQRANVDVY
jgi:phage gp16-like protein